MKHDLRSSLLEGLAQILQVADVDEAIAGAGQPAGNLSLIDGNAQANTGNCIRNFGSLTLQDVRMSSYSGAEFTLAMFNDDGSVIFKNQVIIE
jgi:hypothetical protein